MLPDEVRVAVDDFGNPVGTIYVELRHIYDGISVAQLPDGTMKNLWPVESSRHKSTQEWITAHLSENSRG